MTDDPAPKGPEGAPGQSLHRGFDLSKPEGKRTIVIKTPPGQALAMLAGLVGGPLGNMLAIKPKPKDEPANG